MTPGAKPGSLAAELPERTRILVVSLRRIGDVLLTTPLIRSLKRALPDAAIDALVFAGTDGILRGNPDIDRIITMPARPSFFQSAAIAMRLWWRYDLAISTQIGDRPTFFAFAAARRRAGLIEGEGSGFGQSLKAAMLHAKAPTAKNIHRVEQVLRLVDAIGIARVPELVCPAAAPNSVAEAGRYAVIHASPMFAYKEWTRDGWRALAAGLERRQLAVVAIGAPGELERQYLDHVWRGVAEVHQLRWPETMAALKNAAIYIGPDTSVTHLAAAAGCPTVALFGPMDPRVWGPWPVGGLREPWLASGKMQNRGNVWIVQNPLPCVPCTFEGCERNISSRSICLDELAPEQVLAAVDQALARA